MPANPPERLKRRDIPELPRLELGLRSLPAWAISLLFHVAVVVILGVFWTARPAGTGGDPDRPVGIAVVYESQGEESYSLVESTDDEQGATDSVSPSASIENSLATSSDLIDSAQQSLANLLPGSVDAGAESEAAAGGVGLSGGGEGVSGSGGVSTVKTTVFGIEGEGSRFLYVFDRSDSMNGYEGAPLRAAKRELSESIESLGEAHQFQVIFYNEYATAYGGGNPGGPKLLRGMESSKREALRFIRNISAEGSTEHIPAIRRGLSMNPDVLFFLTDADRPIPSSREMESILSAASRTGTTIHCIQFGATSQQNSGGWIEELARQTSGQYRYINLAKL
ncbi:MAG: hypothetical protein Aurels2KO_00260 [Aureliella sp.]